MAGFVIIPDSMEAAMKRDLDALRDSLPEEERPVFEAERHIHRQAIIDHYTPSIELDASQWRRLS